MADSQPKGRMGLSVTRSELGLGMKGKLRYS